MSWCPAEYGHPTAGIVRCARPVNHAGNHHAFDDTHDVSWPKQGRHHCPGSYMQPDPATIHGRQLTGPGAWPGRGICPTCGRDYKLSWAGRITAHRLSRASQEGPPERGLEKGPSEGVSEGGPIEGGLPGGGLRRA